MRKFDAKRLTHKQLVEYARANLECHHHIDGRCSPHFQALLDAARVPEPTAAELEGEFIDLLIKRSQDNCITYIRVDNDYLSDIRVARKREAGEGRNDD